jgi:DNA-directed RNA polymerase specialized sigma24 family protein
LKPIGDISGIDYGAPRVQENRCKLDLAEQLTQVEALERDIENYQRLLINIKERRLSIENRINDFEGLEYRVAYLLIIEKISLREIAEIIGYSYGYVKNISSRMKKTF